MWGSCRSFCTDAAAKPTPLGDATDKRFTGHQVEGSLYFMQARFYDPTLGRATPRLPLAGQRSLPLSNSEGC